LNDPVFFEAAQAMAAALWRENSLSKAALARLDEPALRAALGLATWAAAITASRPGADPPWAHELEGAAP